MSGKALLAEFPPVSTAAWEDLIRKDLKGADYAKKLVWQDEDGLSVRPYYRSEDIAGLEYMESTPGGFPYAGGDRASADWRIREEIEEADPKKANEAARAALAAGAEEIEFCGCQVGSAADLDTLLADLHGIHIHFHCAAESLLQLLISSKKELIGSAGFDPLTNLEFAARILPVPPTVFAPFTINGGWFEETGATVAQEIGFTLAAGIDFLVAMQERNIDIARSAESVTFSFAIGSSYFFQIAKLRAFRLLWARVVECFGGKRESAVARIHARTSRWNETIYNSHINILRGTTEAMSAAIGGADSISVALFDECSKRPNDASKRLARNTQVLLKHEAQLAHVSDPGGGSYYIEVLTDFVASEAWKVMQEIEAGGGFTKVRADGKIDQTLTESRTAKEKAIATRRKILIGTNQYPNLAEKVLEDIDTGRFIAKSAVVRGAHSLEEIRLCTERHAARTGQTPRVLLAEMGDLKMRSARSAFASNFFGCAGFEIAAQYFNSPNAVSRSRADLIVLCSSDAEYPSLAAALISDLKKNRSNIPVIITGYPDSVEQLKAIGVADFVHARSDAVEMLGKWQQALGIEE